MAIRSIVGVLIVAASAAVVRASPPPWERDFDELVVVQVPTDGPSDAEVLRALPKAARNDITITKELLIPRKGPVCFYPGVGLARLEEFTFKCTVYSSDRTGVGHFEVVYIDRSGLRPAP
jgi:hypothetical protein